MHTSNLASALIICFLFSLGSVSAAEQEKRISTLWSDKADCSVDGARFIAIGTFRNTYKVAACVPMGCRIAVKEFGKKPHAGSYRDDPKFNWLSETEFETQINGRIMHFFQCDTKQKKSH